MLSLVNACRRHADALIIATLGSVSLAFHLALFRFGPHPFGYDTGFYRRYLIEPLVSFPNTAVPGLGDDALIPRILLDILRLTGLTSDVILYGSYIVFFVLLPILIYILLFRHAGRGSAFLAGIFVALSPIQFEAYGSLFWKNAWALLVVFFAFIALERRWFYPVLAADIAIALSHKTTAIVYIITLCVLWVLHARNWRTALHILLTTTVLAVVNIGTIQDVVGGYAPVAIFLSWSEFLWFALPFIIATMAVNIRLRHLPIPNTIVAFTVVVCVYPLLHLPFYERIFLFTDIALAILAAYAVSYMLSYIATSERSILTWAYLTVLCICGAFFAGSVVAQFHEVRPQIPREHVDQIEAISALVPPGATILTTTSEAPWFEGWTTAHIVAPGMLRDTHPFEEWAYIWGDATEKERIAFLADFEHPLYISTFNGFEYLIGIPPSCLREIHEYLLVNECR